MTTSPALGHSISAIDLFCGVGGLTHGLIRGGIPVVAGYDLDPSCRFPFESNNAVEFVECDVSELTAEEIKARFVGDSLSLIAGCAPCQPFSTYSRSGRSKKRVDDWRLVGVFGELVSEVQPDFVTMENVPQLLDHKVFKSFERHLKGYTIWREIVDCDRLGVPQSRRRLVLLASRHGDEGLSLPQTAAKPTTVRKTISALPKIEAGETDRKDPLHTASSLSATNLRRIRASKPGGTWRDWDAELQADCHRRSSGATYPSVYGRMEWDTVAPTITTQCFGYGNGRFGHPDQDRAISLREAAMLQTFPRSYTFVDKGERVRFNKLGRLIGNAVPVRLGEVIAKTLLRHASTIVPPV